MNEQLTQTLSILVQAAEMGQSKGAFALAEAGIISQAVNYAKDQIEAAAKEKEGEMKVVEDKPKKTK